MATTLLAREVPPAGGDTLSPAMQELRGPLQAVNSSDRPK